MGLNVFDGDGHFFEDQFIGFVKADSVNQIQRDEVDAALNHCINPRNCYAVVARIAERVGARLRDADAVLHKDCAAARARGTERGVREAEHGTPARLSSRCLCKALRAVAISFCFLQEDYVIRSVG